MFDSGYDLKLEPIAFADGWAVFCESEVRVFVLRQWKERNSIT